MTRLLCAGLLACVGGVTPAAAVAPDSVVHDHTAASLRAALLAPEQQPVQVVPQGRSRSIPLALALSAAVPGLGQAYNRQWIKAVAGVAVEAGLVVGYRALRTRGLDGEDAYQAYAHDYWSPVRYAGWLNDYAAWLTASFGTPIDAATISIPEPLLGPGFDVTMPDAWSLDQRRALNQLFGQIRAMEREVIHPETGASFSHQLPQFGDQQYYELIGKYFQFAPGWSDYPAWLDEEGNPVDAVIDPERTGPNGSKPNISGRFLEYAEDHGQANDYLRQASRLSIFFIFNHVIAAVDAAIFAKVHNDRLEPGVTMGVDATGAMQPMAQLRLRF